MVLVEILGYNTRTNTEHIMTKLSTYDRTAQRILKMQTTKRQATAAFINGKLITGSKSLHRTAAGRMWRTFWRIKYVR